MVNLRSFLPKSSYVAPTRNPDLNAPTDEQYFGISAQMRQAKQAEFSQSLTSIQPIIDLIIAWSKMNHPWHFCIDNLYPAYVWFKLYHTEHYICDYYFDREKGELIDGDEPSMPLHEVSPISRVV